MARMHSYYGTHAFIQPCIRAYMHAYTQMHTLVACWTLDATGLTLEADNEHICILNQCRIPVSENCRAGRISSTATVLGTLLHIQVMYLTLSDAVHAMLMTLFKLSVCQCLFWRWPFDHQPLASLFPAFQAEAQNDTRPIHAILERKSWQILYSTGIPSVVLVAQFVLVHFAEGQS